VRRNVYPVKGKGLAVHGGKISAGHAFVQNLRRGHYELDVDANPQHQLRTASVELARAI
jgi:hypothetical protein